MTQFTLCQDRACPLKQQCQRYDPRPMEDKTQSYFLRSPRGRDTCDWFAPFNGENKPAPLTSDWPKDDQ